MSNGMVAAKLLIGLGLVGKALQSGPQSVVALRTTLAREGFDNNEISLVLRALRRGQIPPVLSYEDRSSGTSRMSLDGVIARL